MAVVKTHSRAAASAPPIAASMGETLDRRQMILVLVGVMLGWLLSALDRTMVGPAWRGVFPEWNGRDHYTWVFPPYLLARRVVVPFYGRQSDFIARPRFSIGA